jgi:ATP-dependent helicase HrpB
MIQLPIEQVLDQIKDQLAQHDQLILEAPPGAGKTTLVPLALLDQPWLGDGKIIMLEPRRLAARTAAERMAELLNESVGETVGYRVRMDKKVSKKTRIEVVTDGVLNRMLQADPALYGISLVIFDEFHERSLDGDLGLALSLQGRTLFGDLRDTPLKLLIMSATLDGKGVQELLEIASGEDCPVITSEGRAYPVDIRWTSSKPTLVSQSPAAKFKALIDQTTQCVLQALSDQQGSLLVFLPGQREIKSVQQELSHALASLDSILLTPLYGGLPLNEQKKAIQPAPEGCRKIVLTTSIAETSLTIEGVRVVIDSGLSRLPEYDPKTAMTRLKTERLSKASAKQRAGRAGRIEPGVCYRLWSEEQHQSLAQFTPPEIDQADLSSLALQLIQWGVPDPSELDWMTPPKSSAFLQARTLLKSLDALSDDEQTLTAHGEAIAQLPMPPRLAHMLVKSTELQLPSGQPVIDTACHLAALLSERDFLSGSADIQARLTLLATPSNAPTYLKQTIKRINTLASQFKQSVSQRIQTVNTPIQIQSLDELSGILLALAYPDRIALPTLSENNRSPDKAIYKLSNGRQAELKNQSGFAKDSPLAIAQLSGQTGESKDQIFLASTLNIETLKIIEPKLFTEHTSIDWCEKENRLLTESQLRLGKLLVRSQPISSIPEDEKRQALTDLVKRKGLELLPWTPEIQNWRQRIELVRSHNQDQSTLWPDLSDTHLLQTLDQWLAPYLSNISHINHFKKLDLKNILMALLPWPLPQRLDELAPERIRVPSGSNIKIDYSQEPPVLAVKLQEMFGQTDTPTIVNSQVKLLIHLLSPAQRPLQVTQDLAGFWNSSYELVKKDMKGRYPKHYWPDNPLEAEATARAKPRK